MGAFSVEFSSPQATLACVDLTENQGNSLNHAWVGSFVCLLFVCFVVFCVFIFVTLSSSLLSLFYFLWFVCLCTWFPRKPKKGVRFSGGGVTDSSELPHGYWEWNPGLLEEQALSLNCWAISVVPFQLFLTYAFFSMNSCYIFHALNLLPSLDRVYIIHLHFLKLSSFAFLEQIINEWWFISTL